MSEFRKCFHAIDIHNTGRITIEDLRNYMKKMDYTEKFVTSWIKLFRVSEDGVITYDQFCKTLGLMPRKHVAQLEQTGPNVQLQESDLPGPSLETPEVTEPVIERCSAQNLSELNQPMPQQIRNVDGTDLESGEREVEPLKSLPALPDLHLRLLTFLTEPFVSTPMLEIIPIKDVHIFPITTYDETPRLLTPLPLDPVTSIKQHSLAPPSHEPLQLSHRLTLLQLMPPAETYRDLFLQLVVEKPLLMFESTHLAFSEPFSSSVVDYNRSSIHVNDTVQTKATFFKGGTRSRGLGEIRNMSPAVQDKSGLPQSGADIQVNATA